MAGVATLARRPRGRKAWEQARTAARGGGRWDTAKGALVRAVRASFERLEPRQLLSGSILYVNDDWKITTNTGVPGLSGGDIVSDFNDESTPSLTGLTYGTNAFSTVTAALTVATSGDVLVMAPSTFVSDEVINNAGVTVMGWPYFVAHAGDLSGYTSLDKYNGSGNGSLLATVNGGSFEVTASGVTIEGMTMKNATPFGAIHVDAGVTGTSIRSNTFLRNDASVVVAGSAAIDGNSFASGVDAGTIDLQVDSGASLVTVGASAANTFGAATFVKNGAAAEVDVSNNDFVTTASGTVHAGTETDLAKLYALENQITDGLDAPASGGVGLVRLQAGKVFVSQASGSIQRGVNVAISNDTIYVQDGTFNENVTVTKPLTLLGANASIAGQAARGSETYIISSGIYQSAVFTIASSNVTIKGFTINGDDAANSLIPLTSGDDTNASYGIKTSGVVSGINIQNNIIEKVSIGFRGDGNGSTASGGNVISNNWFDSIGAWDWGYAVNFRTNFYADVTNNKMTRVQSGLQFNNLYLPSGSAQFKFQNNEVTAYGAGVWANQLYSGAPTLVIDGNTISGLVAPNSSANSLVRSNYDGRATGLMLVTIQNTATVTVTNNNLSGLGYGVILYNTENNTPITLNGSNTISGNTVGVYLTNEIGFNPVTGTQLGGNPASPASWNTASGVNNPTGVAKVVLDGLSLAGNTTGVQVSGANAFSSYGVQVTFQNGVAISGGTTGLAMNGAAVTLVGDTLADTTFSGQSGDYVALSGGALAGHEIDAKNVTFDAVLPADTTLATMYGVEDKITDYIDDGAVGFLRLRTGHAYVTQKSALTHAGALQRGINVSAANDTVHVTAGTFQENVTVNKPLTLLGANEAVAGQGVRGSETRVVSSGLFQSAVFTLAASNVTVKGFTVDGDDPAFAAIALTSGADTNASYGFKTTGTVSNLNISNNIIENVSIGFRGDNLSSGNSIDSNWFDSIGAWDWGYAVNFRTSFYADVTNNRMTRVQSGLQFNNLYQSNGSPSFKFQNNDVTTYGAGVWANQIYSAAPEFIIDGNTITGIVAPNSTANDMVRSNFDGKSTGLMLVTVQDNAKVTVTNNNLSGLGYGVILYNTYTSNTITLNNSNTISGNTVGVYLTNEIGFNPVTGTQLGGDPANPAAWNSGSGHAVNNPLGTAKVVLDGLSLAGNTTGVQVSGANAFSSYGVQVTFQNGVAISGGTTGLAMNGAAVTLVGDTLADTTFSGQSGDYVALSGGALAGHEINAKNVTFDAVVPADTTLATMYGVEDKIRDYIDDGAVGFVRVRAGHAYVTQKSELTNAGALQRGINVSADTDTVHVTSGTFVAGSAEMPGSLYIGKTLTLQGAQVGIDARTRTGDETVVVPGASDPNPYHSTSQNVMYVASSGVTIDGFTVDGDNPALTSGVVLGGADINAAEGIVSYQGVDNITVQNNIVRNTSYAGIDFDNYYSGGAATGANVITRNLVQNLGGGGFGYGIGIVLYDNFYASVTENAIDHARVGVQTGNFYRANPGAPASISNNAIAVDHLGIFYNLHYGSSTPFTISGNTITAIADPTASYWDGMEISSQQNAANVIISGNTINGSAAVATGPVSGYEIWNTPTSAALTISGGSIAGVDNGVFVNNYEGYDSDGGAAHITVDGVTITARQAGVYVKDSPLNTNGSAVSATITGDTEITTLGAGVGIKVSGETASVTVVGNDASIHGNAIGIDVNAGSAVITGNHLYDNTTGIRFTNGGQGSVTANNFAGTTDNGTDLRLDSDAGNVSIGTGNSFAGNTYYIDNQSPQSFNLVGTSTGFNVGSDFQIEDRMFHALDSATSGLIRWTTGSLFVTTPGSGASDETIQRAINAAADGDTINVASGTFAENLVVNKSVTITGAGQGATKVVPAVSAPTTGGSLGGSTVVLVDADNVTIQNLTVDGDNTSLTSGVVVGGADIDARTGIITNWAHRNFNNFTVKNVTVQNIYLRGIQYGYASGFGGSFDFENNTVLNVQGDSSNSIAIFNSGSTGIIRNNTVSYSPGAIVANWSLGTDFSNNTVTHAGTGIHSDNAQGDDTITGNTISAGSAGAYGIFTFVPYGQLTVSDNVISDVDVGLAVFGGAGGSTAFSNNSVSVRAGGAGAYVTSYELGWGFGNVTASFSGDTFTGGDDGLYIDSSGGTASTTVSVSGVTIDDPTYGIEVVGSNTSVAITGNHIFGNGTGIRFSSGGHGSVTANNFAGTTDNGTDLRLDSDAGAVAVGTGNSFAGSTFYIDNLSTQDINLTGTSTSFSESDNFRIEDRMHHRLDTDRPLTNGLVTWVADNVFVTKDGTDHDIQRGIDAASAGDTVNIEAGTYALTADIGISKAITLSGPNAAITASGTTPREPEALLNGGGTLRIRISTTDQVTVRGLSLSGLLVDSYTPGTHMALVNNNISALPGNMFFNAPALFTMTGNSISATPDDWDVALIAGDWNAGSTVDIQDNLFTNTSTTSTATGLNLSNVQGTVMNNTFKDVAFYGVLVANNSGLTVNGNTFDDIYNPDPSVYPSTGGVRFYTPGPAVDVTLSGNTFKNSFAGIAVRQNSSTVGATINIAGNTFSNNAFAIINLGSGGLAPAGDNVFDGITLSSATLGQLYDIADKIVDGVDIAGVGLVRLKAGQVYVTPNSFYNPGSGAITNTASASIQRGIDAASANDTVNVEAGGYTGNINVNKTVTLLGAGSAVSGSVLTASSGNALQISASNVSVQGLRLVGNAINNGLYFDSTLSSIAVTDLVATNFSYAAELHNSANITGLTLDQFSGINSNDGLRVATTGKVNGLTITNSHFDNNNYGFETYATSASTTSQNDVTNVSISNTTFNGDKFKGLYVEKLNNATLDGVIVNGSGWGTSSPNGININLKYGSYGNLTIRNSSFDSDGTGTASGAALMIDIRNDAPSYNSNPASIASVTLSNLTFTGNSPIELSLGDRVTGVSMSGVSLTGTGAGLVYFGTAGGLNLGDTYFAGTLAQYVVNKSVSTIDATAASFNGFVGGTATLPADLPLLFATEDKIFDGIDVSGAGLVRLMSGNLFVTPSSFVLPYSSAASVQRAVDLAGTGETINIQDGTYVGQVVVQSNVALVGQSEVGTILKSPATLGVNFTTPSSNLAVVLVKNASNVTVQNLTVDGDHKGAGNYRFIGIGYFNAGGTVDHVTVKGITDATFTGAQAGNAIYAYSPVATNTWTVSNNTVLDYQKNGITANGAGLTAYITGNSITGQNLYGVNGQNGVQIGFGALGFVSGNTITNNRWNNGTDPEATSVLLYQAATGTTVSGNTMSGSDLGIAIVASNATIDGNNISGNLIGISADTGAIAITNNDIAGNGDGIELYGNLAGSSVRNNFIRGNSNDGILVDGSVTSPPSIQINSITGNGHAGLESAIAIDATNNWWGSSEGPHTALNTFNANSTGDVVIGSSVLLSAWLNDGTDALSAMGFQHAEAGATPPTEPTIVTGPILDSGSSSSDNITSDNTPTFTGTADSGTTVELLEGTTVLGTVTASGGTWSITSSALADGAHTISVRSTQLDGLFSTSASQTFYVDTASPDVSGNQTAYTVDEGTGITLTGTFTSAANPGGGSYSEQWQFVGSANGQIVDGNTGSTLTFTPSNNGTYSFNYIVTDAAGNESVSNVIVTVDNVAPAVAATNATVTVDEGQTANNAGTWFDPGADVVTLSASVGTVTKNPNGTWTWSLDTTDGPDESQVVTITATDSDSASTSTSFSLVVNNVTPTIGSDAATITVNEGQTANNTGTWFDPGADVVTLTASVGTVTKNPNGTWSWSLDTTDGPDESQTVVITATDSDSASSTTSFSLVVNNVTPTVGADTPTITVNEGQAASNTGTWFDPGADVVTLTASVGTVTKNPNGTWSWSLDTTDGPDESQTVVITATDSDSASSTTSFSLVVNNVTPVATSDAAIITVNEGQIASNTGTWFDPGADVVTLTASVGTVTKNPNGTWSWSLDTTDGPDQSQTVVITATDSDSASSTTSFSLVVNNVTPTIGSDAATVTVDEGQTATNTGTWFDPGADVVGLSATIGSVVQNGNGTWSWSFFTNDGPALNQTVTLTATDSDGATSSTSFALTVVNVAPTATLASDSPSNQVGEGSPVTVSFTGGADASSVDAASLHYTYSLTPGGLAATYAAATDGTSHQFTFTDNGTYSVYGRVYDKDGGYSDYSTVVSVHNVAPVITSVTGAPVGSSPEGTPITLTANVTDPSTDTLTFAWTVTHSGLGSASPASQTTTISGRSESFTFTPTNDGTYTVSLQVTDQDGAAASPAYSSVITITDVEPTLTLTDSGAVFTGQAFEGAAYNLTLRNFIDPGQGGGDSVSNVYVDWGDNSTPTFLSGAQRAALVGGGTATVSHVYADGTQAGMPQTINVQVFDNQGEHTGATATVNTFNVAPSSTFSGPASVNEGSSSSVTFFDQNDPSPVDAAATGSGYTYQLDVVDGLGNVIPGGHITGPVAGLTPTGPATFTVPASFLSDGPGSVIVRGRIFDKDGGYTDYFKTITVNNVAPAVNTIANQNVNEGSPLTVSGSVTDPGADSTWTINVNYGDSATGTVFTTGTTRNFSTTHTYTLPGTYTVSLTATDKDGAVSIARTYQVTVANVAPSVTRASGSVTINEGATAVNSGTFGDAGSEPIIVSASVGTVTQDNLAHTWSWSYTPANAAAGQTVTITASDGTASTTTSFTLAVNNLPPTIAPIADQVATQNSPFSIGGSFSDPGAGETFTATVNYGDGAGAVPLTLTGTTFTLNHTYATTGTYTVTVAVNDNESSNNIGTGTFHVTVQGATLQVTSFVQVASGFDFTFNEPIKVGDLALYGNGTTFSSALTIVGAVSGTVAGSAIWDAASNTLHWVKTGGVLAGDTYSVTLVSGTSGNSFHNTAVAAAALDGDGNGTAGDSFVRTGIVVAAPTARIVGLPDFARGTGQAVFVNSQGLQTIDPSTHLPVGGLPVTISDGSGVFAVDFVLNYDPSLLSVSTLLANMTPGSSDWSITVNDATPGHLHVVAYGTSELGSGTRTVLTFKNVAVPGTATYGSADLLRISNVLLNETTVNPVAGVGDEAIHKVVDLGDATGTGIFLPDVFNTMISSLDASYAARVAAALDKGFAAFPLTDPVIIGDVTGNGEISALDASYIAQIASNPALHPEVPATTFIAGPLASVDPTVKSGLGSTQTIFGTRGSSVSAGIAISDDASGLLGANIVVTYDTNLLDVLNVSAGPGWSVVPNINEGTGKVILIIYASNPAYGPQNLATINFTVPAAAPAGVSPLNLAAALNEGALVASYDSGSITLPLAASVTADAGNNNLEGSPQTFSSSVQFNSGAVSYLWSVTKDGLPYAVTGNTSGSFTFTPDDNASYVVSLAVSDAAGNQGGASAGLAVTNVAPTLAISGNARVQQGSPYTLSIGAVTDPGADSVSSYVIHWGDGNTTGITSAALALAGGQVAHTYTDATQTHNITVDVTDEDGLFSGVANPLSVTYNTQIAGRAIFYNNSSFDGNDGTINASDDLAIATDKSALQFPGTAAFANYTSYDKGINGIMVDVSGVLGTVTAGDFLFKVGNSSTLSSWTSAPAPLHFSVRSGAGVGGSSRIEIVWADGVIQKQWLQVTVLADGNTGLAGADIFYFGNAPGESGNSTSEFKVTAFDEIAARVAGTASASVTTVADYNRDGVVDAADEAVAHNNPTYFATELVVLTDAASSSVVTPGVVSTAPTGAGATTTTATPSVVSTATAVTPLVTVSQVKAPSVVPLVSSKATNGKSMAAKSSAPLVRNSLQFASSVLAKFWSILLRR